MSRLFHLEAQELLEKAARETLERIRRDKRRVSRQIQPLLAYIETHLFDPNLNVSQVLRACGVHDHSISLEFKSAVKMPPSAYIQDCRMEVAKRLLRDTAMEVSQISEMLGFASLKTFSRAFGKWAAESPTKYRRNSQSSAAKPEQGQILYDAETWNRALSGALDHDQASRLLAYLHKLYPKAASRPKPRFFIEPTMAPIDVLAITSDELQHLKAEEVWQDLQGLDWEEQLELVRNPGRFKTPDLFYFLRDRSTAEGLSDRKWGLRVARLALEHALVYAGIDRSDGSNPLWAEAWAYLGNAHRLALELPEAERAFEAAYRYLPADQTENHYVHGQVRFLEACLRWYQEELTTAAQLADQAVEHFKHVDNPKYMARSLMTSGIIRLVADQPREALGKLIETEKILKEDGDSYLEWATVFNMATCYLEAGDLESARNRLAQAKGLGSQQRNRYSLALIYQLEGLIALEFKKWREALKLLMKARSEFAALELTGHAAAVALDLAYLHSLRRNYQESALFVAEVIPLFESIRYYHEAFLALELLRGAIAEKELKVEVLRKSRDILKGLRRKPTFHLDQGSAVYAGI